VFHDTDIPLRRALRLPLSFNRLRGVFFPATTRKTEPLTPLSPPSIRLRTGLWGLSSSEPSKAAKTACPQPP
jgi:hypothetical protein